jgi:hypothetical protein
LEHRAEVLFADLASPGERAVHHVLTAHQYLPADHSAAVEQTQQGESEDALA